MRKLIIGVLMVSFACAYVSAHAQEALCPYDSLTIFFRQGVSSFEPDYKQNAQRCEDFVGRLHELNKHKENVISKVQIYSSASPEGKESLNERLAEERAKNVINHLHAKYPFTDSLVFVQTITEDWGKLAEMVASDQDVPSKDKVLEIIAGPSASRKGTLMKLDGGLPWNYLYKKYFPQLGKG